MKKKILSLLVLLAAAVSGAWADELATSYTSDAELSTVTVSADMEVNIAAGVTVTINNGLTIESGTLTVNGPGTLVVNGTNGASGNDGSSGDDGGAAISGNIAVYGATVQATGGNGGNGGNSDETPGGWGGNAGAAFSGAVSIYSGKIIAQGGAGGYGGGGNDQGEPGESSAAFSGTLTVLGGTVEATGGDNNNNSTANAFASNVIMKASTYELLGGDDVGSATPIDVNAITNKQYVKITAPDFAGPDYELTDVASDHGSGQVDFYIDGNKVDFAMQADEGKEVTVKVTPDAGWVVDPDNVSAAMPYINWESAGARRRISGATDVEILTDLPLTYVDTDEQGVATFTFTMPTASVKVKGAYKKVSTLYFDPAGKTNLMKVTVGGTNRNLDAQDNTVKIAKVENVLEGTAVTLTANTGYKFRKVAVKKGGSVIVNLSTLTAADLTNGAYILENGDVLTGTLEGQSKPYNIQIADGATVTLDGVTINGYNETTDEAYNHAGITCLGDAIIILKGTNSVKGFEGGCPGIYVPGDATNSENNKTLTIKGDGSLVAQSNGVGAGIGGGWARPCGNIIIEGGTITATGGLFAAGIGGGYQASCGTITITKDVTSVTATKGSGAESIGAGNGGTCLGVNIENGANVTQQ